MFGWNSQRRRLVSSFSTFLSDELRRNFYQPVFVNGSLVTDKEAPNDIDVALDLTHTTGTQQFLGFQYMLAERNRIREQYHVDFWINLPGQNDFSDFFCYVGVKTARFKSLSANHRKGILRIM